MPVHGLYAQQGHLYSAALDKVGTAAGPTEPDPENYLRVTRRRDRIAEQRDDSQHERALREQGVTPIRGRAQVLRQGVIEVAGEVIECGDLIIATGSEPIVPAIEGLAGTDFWFSDRLLSSTELPEKAVVLGDGPVGCEVAQILARYGCRGTGSGPIHGPDLAL